MSNSAHSTIGGLFHDAVSAQRASTELQRLGWTAEHIQSLGKRPEGFLSSLKQTFSEQNQPASDYSTELNSLDLPEDRQPFYQQELQNGATLLSVQDNNRPLEVRELLQQAGAYDVFIPVGQDQTRTIPLRKEVVQVHKQWTETGEIRIHKRVITEQQTFTIPVTREEVTIEKVSTQNTSAAAPQFQPPSYSSYPAAEGSPVIDEQISSAEIPESLVDGGTIRILVHAEKVVFEKRPVVIEEIVIKKKIHQETTSTVVPVLSEEARIEKIGNVIVHQTAPEAANHVSEAGDQQFV